MPIPKSCMELGRLIISEANMAESPRFYGVKRRNQKDEETIRARISKNKGSFGVKREKKKAAIYLVCINGTQGQG